MPKHDFKALMRAIRTEPVLPKYQAGRVFGWGRRATDQAVREGQLPIIPGPKEAVPTAWIRRQLRLDDSKT
jgi:hypothetical protein